MDRAGRSRTHLPPVFTPSGDPRPGWLREAFPVGVPHRTSCTERLCPKSTAPPRERPPRRRTRQPPPPRLLRAVPSEGSSRLARVVSWEPSIATVQKSRPSGGSTARQPWRAQCVRAEDGPRRHGGQQGDVEGGADARYPQPGQRFPRGPRGPLAAGRVGTSSVALDATEWDPGPGSGAEPTAPPLSGRGRCQASIRERSSVAAELVMNSLRGATSLPMSRSKTCSEVSRSPMLIRRRVRWRGSIVVSAS